MVVRPCDQADLTCGSVWARPGKAKVSDWLSTLADAERLPFRLRHPSQALMMHREATQPTQISQCTNAPDVVSRRFPVMRTNATSGAQYSLRSTSSWKT